MCDVKEVGGHQGCVSDTGKVKKCQQCEHNLRYMISIRKV